MKGFLHYNSQNMRSDAVGKFGVTTRELDDLSQDLISANETLESLRKSGEQGFFDLPFDDGGLEMIKKHAREVQKHFETLLIIGIGGSDLGARALWSSLSKASENAVNIIFLGNPDPDQLTETFRYLNMETTAINVVSKSGTTLETMSVFTLARQKLIDAVGETQHDEHIYVTTDPERGVLYEIAQSEGYTILPHPLNVGGRFAVLSIVGLFPAACADIDIEAILQGARWVAQEHDEKTVSHPAVDFAALHYLAYTKRDQDMHVLMPYSAWLDNVGLWYRQLWAESLGKIKDGEHVGPTPIASLGTVDQHSQIQLYNQGPNNKVVTFVEVENFENGNLRVPNTWSDHDEIGYMADKTFQEIMHAERTGTAEALAENSRPNGTITIPEKSPEAIGALLFFFELATAYMGELLKVDTYNQPGVEAGKLKAREILNN